MILMWTIACCCADLSSPFTWLSHCSTQLVQAYIAMRLRAVIVTNCSCTSTRENQSPDLKKVLDMTEIEQKFWAPCCKWAYRAFRTEYVFEMNAVKYIWFFSVKTVTNSYRLLTDFFWPNTVYSVASLISLLIKSVTDNNSPDCCVRYIS